MHCHCLPLPAHLLFLTIFVVSAATCANANTAGRERAALLELKASVSDPAGVLSGWIAASDHCSWQWISCDLKGRVVAINISAYTGDTSPSCSRSGPFRCYYSDPDRRLAGKLSPAIGELTELRILSLPFHSFEGDIAGEIWGLENLEVIDLEGSSLVGTLPSTFPSFLRVLNLASNLITGEIPISLCHNCIHLEILDLSRNRLNGSLPTFLNCFPKLSQLHLSFNRLENSIPEEIGAGCLSLEHLDLSGNSLVGSIPSSLGNCSQLRSLLLFSNRLDGVIPSSLGQLENLRALDVSRNCLSGYIPEELGNCKELAMVVLTNMFDYMQALNSVIYHEKDESNYFHGGISWKITSLPKLRILWAPRGNLEGEFPSYWGICESLEMVSLGQNSFTGEIPRDLDKCVKIKLLDLSLNKLTGWLGEELPVPCMDFFDVSGNRLSGSIPRFINKKCPLLPSPTNDLLTAYSLFFTSRTIAEIEQPYFESSRNYAIHHNFGRNNLSGTLSSLPVATDRYGNRTVYNLRVDENSIAGSLTNDVFRRCRELGGLVFNCYSNLISGEISADIGAICRALMVLNASSNQITGVIPQSISLLDKLVALDLSMNQLKDVIPAGLSGLKALKYLNLSNNNFSGGIPAKLNELHSLQELDISSNFMTGEIPGCLVKLRKLSVLMLNDNKFSGNVPSGFANVASLSKFNMSFNDLSGPLPFNSSKMSCDRIRGNPLLQACLDDSSSGSVSRLQRSGGDSDSLIKNSIPAQISPAKSSGGLSTFWIIAIASAAGIVSVLLVLIALYIYSRKCLPSSSVKSSEIRDVTIFVDLEIPLTYESVVRATGNFNTSNCIGSGGFGATYKAEVSPGVLVAIKRLSVGRVQGVQQFHAEIKTLGRWRHSNLVTLIGYYGSDEEMFLIYNYLPGGNLENFLQERSRRPVDWKMLHKIALDVARALAYLHDQCAPRILHRDVKPSNILLDNDFNAYLSDFGLARLLGNSETHATTAVAGTFGYVAPEYAMTCRVSDKADVYSYGVVLLELLSDKKVLDPFFSSYGDGFNIVTWASMLLHQTRAPEFFTEGLCNVAPLQHLIDTLKLAIRCTEEQLSQRPSMRQVVRVLKEIQP
ncbi:LRR receptor-like serine/threonine-protein kinase RPK2 [Dendrobium catenatum]|uniref:non-specific serine/threonine protein kinase n=1 Tax=Dendrobium catenatum TaxID=906689 RepID=A0A2I0WZQ6_9ASPA|nr:LRR receptor-like serine/threonine-protein kinase RPK2 [Dendrobium catenatum]PKU81139.1 LRR receptor-like serine/threonine-protein kinase RPK2 [Dendrobium catenatum]